MVLVRGFGTYRHNASGYPIDTDGEKAGRGVFGGAVLFGPIDNTPCGKVDITEGGQVVPIHKQFSIVHNCPAGLYCFGVVVHYSLILRK